MFITNRNRWDAGIMYETDEGGSGGGEPVTEPTTNAAPTLADIQAELERTKAALKAANKEAGDRRKQLEAIETANKAAETEKQAKAGEFEQLYQAEQAKAAALDALLHEVQAQVKRNSIKAAIEAAARAANFADPADAYVFLDLDSIEMGEDGKPKDVDVLVKGLAKSKPYLVAQHEVQQGNGARPKMAAPAGTEAADQAAKQKHERWAHSQF